MRFLQDHYPGIWEKIQHCRMSFIDAQGGFNKRGTYGARPVPWTCHQIPYCILCTRFEANKRTHKLLDAIQLCTPPDKPPRFLHIVQTAPIYEVGNNDPGQWGWLASQDHNAFARLVHERLADAYGDGIGAWMSYQDFGERAFAKRHPHQDLTLNGYRLQDGEPVVLPTLNLRGAGRQRWDEELVQLAKRFDVNAGRGSVDISQPIFGRRRYWRAARYQVRELVDFTKIVDYRRDESTVTWLGYRDGVPIYTRFGILDFKAGVAEYAHRLGTWGHGTGTRRELHTRHGHLAKRGFKAAVKAFGGRLPPHGGNCWCGRCVDWESLDLTSEEEAALSRHVPVTLDGPLGATASP